MSTSTSSQIDTYLPYMRDVEKCEKSLHELNLMWHIIESSAKMNCPVEAGAILPTIAATRNGFGRLEQELVASLVHEKIRNVQAELSTKAKYVIDIVVRNLYERTADVGFLATDKELCVFAAGRSDDVSAIRARLRAYRNKYTVYDEIILLDTAGNVLVQIDETTPLEGSVDPLIQQTLASDTYVETFRYSDLRPSKREALIYSRRMYDPENGAVIGILCLCFAFEVEMASIFSTHRDPMERSNMLLLDANNRVIASADPLWIPLGAKVPINHDAMTDLKMYAGRKYLVHTHHSSGYQGYPGPSGWKGQVMIPVDSAFSNANSTVLSQLSPEVMEGLLTHAHSFCPPLFEIMTAAETIRRVVWNGQVMTSGQGEEQNRLKSILEQISETGARSNELFSQSIQELFETVLASGLRDGEFISHLLVDLLDRNLYERANDCRWWALSSELRELVANPEHEGRASRIKEILEYINGLYTVYKCLVVYDREGNIVAGTHLDQAMLPSSRAVDDETLRRVLSLRSEQEYFVSPFMSSPIGGHTPTYVYHAAICRPGGREPVGGIGIVFDAETELLTMLQAGIAGKEGIHAYFVDREGSIIASTDPTRPVGRKMEIDPSMLSLKSGSSASQIILHDENYAVLGCTASHGYREFKVSDGYSADVLAVVIRSFGPVRSLSRKPSRAAQQLKNNLHNVAAQEFATFYLGGDLFAIETKYVRQALSGFKISPVSMGGSPGRIGILSVDGDRTHKDQNLVWSFDLAMVVYGQKTVIDAASQVVIVEKENRMLGVLVSELHAVAKFDEEKIMAMPLADIGSSMLVKQIIKANEGELLIQVIDVDYLFRILMDADVPNGYTAHCGETNRLEF